MLWVVDTIRTRLFLQEERYDLDVPIVIEIEYQLEGVKVISFAVSRLYYNRPLLLKEAVSRSEKDIDSLIDKVVQRAVRVHFASRGYIVEI